MDKILTFADRQAFREWLGKYGTESDGIWLLFSKKGKYVTLSAGDALEEALCHGWIDGQMQSLDDNTYKKYFARRRPTSKWSVKNKKLAQTLREKGLMMTKHRCLRKSFSRMSMLIPICWLCRIRYSVHIPDFILIPNLTKPVKPG